MVEGSVQNQEEKLKNLAKVDILTTQFHNFD